MAWQPSSIAEWIDLSNELDRVGMYRIASIIDEGLARTASYNAARIVTSAPQGDLFGETNTATLPKQKAPRTRVRGNGTPRSPKTPRTPRVTEPTLFSEPRSPFVQGGLADPYKTLGVPYGASEEQIAKAHANMLERAKQMKPQQGEWLTNQANQALKEVKYYEANPQAGNAYKNFQKRNIHNVGGAKVLGDEAAAAIVERGDKAQKILQEVGNDPVKIQNLAKGDKTGVQVMNDLKTQVQHGENVKANGGKFVRVETMGDASRNEAFLKEQKALERAEKMERQQATKALKADQALYGEKNLLQKGNQAVERALGKNIGGKTTAQETLALKMQSVLAKNPQILENSVVKAVQQAAKQPVVEKALARGGAALGVVGKIAGPAAATYAAYEIFSKLRSGKELDANDTIDAVIALTGAVPVLAPIAIAGTVAQMVANNPKVQLAVKQLGINMSGVNMDKLNEDLINSGMKYNPATGEWEDQGVARKMNEANHLSFQATLSNLVKQGVGVDAAWKQVFYQLKSAHATPEEIMAVRDSYNRIKQDFQTKGQSGSLKMTRWSEQLVQAKVQELLKYIKQLQTNKYSAQQIQMGVEKQLNAIPDVRAKSAVQTAIQATLDDAIQKNSQNAPVPNNAMVPGKMDEAKQPAQQTNQPATQQGQNLQYGSRGPQVTKWQQFLSRLGYMTAGQHPPVFGPQTQQGTRQFQQAMGLMVDGIVGPQTMQSAMQQGFA